MFLTMSSDVKLLYLNLDRLLKDINAFLSEETRFKNLSNEDRKQMTNLINRSKIQLQEISKITKNSNEPDEYVDMGSKKSDDYDSEHYSVVDEPLKTEQKLIEMSLQSHIECPYKDVPAKHICRDVKYGYLKLKTRFILVDTISRVYAGISENWLLVYSSEKDSKPSHTINLLYHEAISVSDTNKNGNKQQQLCFELISKSAQDRNYFFKALTHKDMLQWVTQINKCREVPPVIIREPPRDDNQDFDNEDDSEDIYDTIKLNPMGDTKTNIEVPPELPRRPPPNTYILDISRPHKPSPKPPTPEPDTLSDDDSLDSYEEVVTRRPLSKSISKSSFSSDDDDEQVYEPFVQVSNKQETGNIINNTNAEKIDTGTELEKNGDLDRKPSLPKKVSPPVVLPKPGNYKKIFFRNP